MTFRSKAGPRAARIASRLSVGLEGLERRRLLSVSIVQSQTGTVTTARSATDLVPYVDGIAFDGKLLIPAGASTASFQPLTGGAPVAAGDDWWKMLAPNYGSGGAGGGGTYGFVSESSVSTGGTFGGTGLYLTDGTPSGTTPVSTTLSVGTLKADGAEAYFEGIEGGSYAVNLYKTDGTAAGTARVLDAVPFADGFGSFTVGDWDAVGGRVYYQSAAGVCAIDPVTRASQVLLAAPASTPAKFAAVGGRAYFAVGGAVYRTDGTAAGTKLVATLAGEPDQFFGFRGEPHALGPGGTLEAIDPATGGVTQLALPLGSLPSGAPVKGGGKLFVPVGGAGEVVFADDATPPTTLTLPAGSSGTVAVPGGIDFAVTLGEVDSELNVSDSVNVLPVQLWASDGTAAATREIDDAGTTLDEVLAPPVDTEGPHLGPIAGVVGGQVFVPVAASDPAKWDGQRTVLGRFEPAGADPAAGSMQVVGTTLAVRGEDADPSYGGNDDLNVGIAQSGALLVAFDGEATILPPGSITGIAVDARGGNDTINLGGEPLPATVWGGGGADSLTGGAGPTVVDAGNGPDTVQGSYYGDAAPLWVRGGNGNDLLVGGGGDDTLLGGAGDDQLFGEAGNDVLYGFDVPGVALPTGAADNDTLVGGDGNDALDGGPQGDLAFGGDSLAAGSSDTSTGHDTLYGGAGADQLYSGADASVLNGNTGNDSLWSASQSVVPDTLNGGPGNDAAVADAIDWVASVETFPH